MARTAPVPNIPAIPGMNPGLFVLGGGGDGGGSGAGGGSGSGNGQGANGQNGGTAAPSDGRSVSHPVDVATGRAFTDAVVDLKLPGPLPLRWERSYSSSHRHIDAGLGFGWMHSLGWRIEVRRRSVIVHTGEAVPVVFDRVAPGQRALGPRGFELHHAPDGSYTLEAEDGLRRAFSASENEWKILSQVEDRNGNRISIRHEDGRLVEIVDCVGRVVHVASTKEGRVESITVKDGRGGGITFATYTYDERGNLVTARDAIGCATRYEYDDDHALTRHVDRTGLTFHFLYDSQGRCVESWGDYPGRADPSLADGLPEMLADRAHPAKGVHHCRISYFDDYTEAVDSLQVRRFVTNRFGTVDKVIDGGFVERFEHNDAGFMVLWEDGEGAVRRWERDPRGRVLSSMDPLGNPTTIERDERGDIVRVLDAMGGVSECKRDLRGNIAQLVDAARSVTSYSYDERGLWIAMIHPNGGRTTLERDAHENPIAVRMPNGHAYVWTYDYLGRPTSETDPTGAVERYVYNDRGDRVAVHHANGGVTQFEYDGEGHPTRVIHADGGTVEVAWGGLHRLCTRKDPNGRIVQLRYNREGEIVELRNERGEVHRFEYDARRRLSAETTFSGAKRSLKRDGCGRVTRVEEEDGAFTEYVYDARGAIIEKHLPDGSAETFEYDAMGRLTSAKNSAGEISFLRDPMGRVVRETQVVDDVPHQVSLVRDVLGMIVERQTSLGHRAQIRRDAAGTAVETVLDGESIHHESDGRGREICRRLARGGVIETSYDPAGRIARKTVLGGGAGPKLRPDEPDWVGARKDSAVADTVYRYDIREELIAEWDSARGSTSFEYDPVGQLTAAIPEHARAAAGGRGPDDAQAAVFRYDDAGNVSSGGEAAEFDRDNRITRRGSAEFDWGPEGRLARKVERSADGSERVTRYEWDGAGLLAKVVTPDGRVLTFEYDPFARRVKKRAQKIAVTGEAVLLGETRFIYCGETLIHEIHRAAAAAGDPIIEERTYAFDDGEWTPLAQRVATRASPDDRAAAGPWYHYVNDFIGAPRRLVRDTGEVAGTLDQTVWGKAEPREGGEVTTPFRLPGQYADEETGLSYNRARYFDPDLGRFLSSDPLGFLGGLNAFAYRWNPTHWIDPRGEEGMQGPGIANDYVRGPPGTFVLTAHGNPQGIDMPGGYTTDPKEIARQIRAHPDYKPGMPIILDSCSTGQGSNSIAQQLSNEMGVPVTAPTETIWVAQDGSSRYPGTNLWIQENAPGGADPGRVGQWNTCTPSLWSRIRRFFGG